MKTGERGDIHLELHGQRLALSSETPGFLEYVSAAMEPFLCAPDGPPAIECRLEWVEGPRARSLREAFGVEGWQLRPDRDLYIDGNTAYWLRIDDFLDLHIKAVWEDGVLRLTGRYYFSLGPSARSEWLRRLRHRGRLGLLRAHRFSTLLYYLVYHPILWRLSRFAGWHVLHGGAVSDGRRAVVLAGMPGCGKSTLAVALSGLPGWRMLSDNLVLFNASSVMACPELLLLDQGSIARAGAGAQALRPTGERRVFGRDAYRPSETELEPVEPGTILVVERGRNSSATELSAEACRDRMRAGNTMAKELRRIAIMGEVLDRIAGTSRPDELADLGRLASGPRCYALSVGAGKDVSEELRGCLPRLFTAGPIA